MMHIISTAKTTVLSAFPTLKPTCTYEHGNNETKDLQFFPRKNLFLEVNKRVGLEFLCIKNVVGQMQISQLRKMNVEKLYCVACQKQGNEEIALGRADGKIKMVNYKTLEVNHIFPAETTRNSVVFLDYNTSDEYISSVYENGIINVYGTKTNTKLETLNFDNNSNLARFHPSKRFNLSVASDKGSVLIYDIQNKKKIFSSTDCHSAPCRDLCMTSELPDMLISVGFDCIINIFDTRKKNQPIQIRYCHPLSTAALSECGNFLCVGNLKGELISYDLRNTKSFITTKKIHDSAVFRIAFVPSKEGKTDTSGHGGRPEGDSVFDLRSSLANLDSIAVGKRDSFCDFLDFQSNKGFDKSRFSTRRDSFDFDALYRKPAYDDRNSIVPAANPSTDDFPAKLKKSGKENIDENDYKNVLQIKGFEETNIKDRTQQEDRRLKNIIEEPLLEIPRIKIITSPKSPSEHIQTGTPSTLNNDESIQESSVGKIETALLLKEINNLKSNMDIRFANLESEIKFNAECNKWQIFAQNSHLFNQNRELTEDIQIGINVLLQADRFVNEIIRLKEENRLLKHELLRNK